jgi:glycosyltransferase involved in cell wall biosynthesis
VLWFTHWKTSRVLRAAERLSTAVVSVDRRSFPLDSAKVRAIGHGIDLSEFPCVAPANGAEVRLLALGRYSRAKGLDVVLRAVGEVPEATLVVHGPALSAEESEHRRELQQLVSENGLGGRVDLGDAVTRSEVPGLLKKSDALVNNMRAGAPDKVVYEAAASCVPVLASNPVFDSLLDERFRFGREAPAELADRLLGFSRLGPAERRAVGQELRRRVEQEHAVDRWAERLLTVAEES